MGLTENSERLVTGELLDARRKQGGSADLLEMDSFQCMSGKARIPDLCEEDKSKIAHLIRQLAKVNEENKRLETTTKELRSAQLKKENELKTRESQWQEKLSQVERQLINERNGRKEVLQKMKIYEIDNKRKTKQLGQLVHRLEQIKHDQKRKQSEEQKEKLGSSNTDAENVFETLEKELKRRKSILEHEVACLTLSRASILQQVRVKLESSAVKQLQAIMSTIQHNVTKELLALGSETHSSAQLKQTMEAPKALDHRFLQSQARDTPQDSFQPKPSIDRASEAVPLVRPRLQKTSSNAPRCHHRPIPYEP